MYLAPEVRRPQCMVSLGYWWLITVKFTRNSWKYTRTGFWKTETVVMRHQISGILVLLRSMQWSKHTISCWAWIFTMPLQRFLLSMCNNLSHYWQNTIAWIQQLEGSRVGWVAEAPEASNPLRRERCKATLKFKRSKLQMEWTVHPVGSWFKIKLQIRHRAFTLFLIWQP